MNRMIEAALGLVVLALFAGFLTLLLSASAVGKDSSASYVAIFQKVDGLGAGDDVRIGGVKVGTVSSVTVDPKSFEVLATLSIAPEFKLTTNARAAVLSSGLLGGAFIDVKAGFGPPLADGGYIENTNDAVNLTEMLSNLVFSVAEQ